MKINLNKDNIFRYLLTVISFVFLFYYIWFRFFRDRLPRDIPFQLNLFSFLILIIICIFYIYIIYKLFTKSKEKAYLIIELLNKLSLFSKPILHSHNLFLTNLSFLTNMILLLSQKIKIYNLYADKISLNILILFDFLPKFLLLIIFLIDIFYFNKLEIFYYCIMLGIIPLLYNYLLYCCTNVLNNLLQEMEQYYYINILSTYEEEKEYENQEKVNGISGFFVSLNYLKFNKYNNDGFINLRYFIIIQAANIMFQHDLYKYTCVETEYAKQLYAEKHNISAAVLQIQLDDISKQLKKKFFDNIEEIIYLQVFLETHKNQNKPTIAKKHLVIILFGYLIGWLYIIIISFHTLDLNEIIEILANISYNIEPFSDLPLIYYARK